MSPTQRPASAGQTALWRFQRLAPTSPAYHMVYACELAPGLDLDRLQAAFAHVVASFEALHCGYRELDGTLWMVRPDRIEADVAIEDAEAWSATAVQDWLLAQADAPFALEAARVCRLRLLRNRRPDGDEIHLCAVFHHISGDFVSVERVLALMFASYRALSTGQALPPLVPGLYWDWLADQGATPVAAGALAFWRDRLADAPPPLDLTPDRPRPRQPSYQGAELDVALWTDLSTGLRALAARLELSLFGLLTALFQVFMHRHTDQADFLLGTPTMTRQQAKYRDLVGYTLNSLPLRARLAGNPRLDEALRALGAEVQQGLRHRQVPLDQLQTLAGPAAERGPLFRHMLTYTPSQREQRFAPYCLREHLATQRGAANELNLRWQDDGRELLAQWRYSADLFEAETIARLATNFTAFLCDALARPQVRLDALTVCRPDDQSRCAGAVQTPLAPTALAAFRQQVIAGPTRPALVEASTSWSYADLDRASDDLAGRLWARGLRPGGVLALALPRSADLILGMLAAWKLGSAYLCLDPALPAARRQHMLSDSGAALVLGRGPVPSELGPVAWLDLDQPAEAGTAPTLTVLPQQAAYLIYTSGSTGRPKGVAVSQGNLVHYVSGVLATLQLPAAATLTALATVAADLGYTAWFGALLSGRTLRLIDEALAADPEALAEALQRRPVDCLKIVPSHLKALLAVADPARLLPRHSLVLGGEGLDLALVQRLRALAPTCRVVNHYGPTETTVGCLADAEVDDRATLSGTAPVGRPLANVQVYVLDRYLNPLPQGAAGELYVGGAGVALGYLGQPGLSAERFLPDPFGALGGRLYRTGDRVRMLADGRIEFLGRIDQQVKIRGFRVELGEIEAALKASPTLREAVVTAQPLPGGEGQRLVAHVVPAASLDLAALRAQFAERLPDYMLPAAWVTLAELPRLANGKVDRQRLPAPVANPAPVATADAAPANALEAQLIALWQELLARPAIGRADNFFALGGDSILALQLIAKARKAGLRFSPRELFEQPTPAALAALLKDHSGAPTPPVAPAPALAAFALAPLPAAQLQALAGAELDDAYPLSPLQKGLFFHSLLAGDSGVYVNQLQAELTGRFDPERFLAAWRAAVAAHPLLRTGLLWQTLDEPLQGVWRSLDLPVHEVDWRGRDETECRADLAAYCAADRRRGFVLNRPPLQRLALFRRDEDRWWLLWSRHHLIADGWSSVLLLEEILARYAGQQPPVRPAYRAYIGWLGRRPALNSAYWAQQLGDFAGAGSLPVLAAPAADATVHYRTTTLAFTPEETERLQALARRSGVTLNTLIQAAWALLLARYNGQDQVVFGVTSSGRPSELAGADQMLGVFINTLPLCLAVPPSLGLADYLQAVQAAAVALREHEQTPLADILKASPRGAALFDTLLVFQNLPAAAERELVAGDLRLRALDNLEQTNYGLTLEALPGRALQLLFSADRARLPEPELAALMRHCRTLLLALDAPAGTRLGALALLPAAEWTQLAAWGRQDADYALAPDWEQRVAASVARHPDRVVARAGADSLSYGQLWQRAETWARGLRALGVGADQPVALLAERGLDLLCLMVATLRAGAAWLPLDPGQPPARWQQVLARAGRPLVVCAPVQHAALAAVYDGRVILPAELTAHAPQGRLPAQPARPEQLAYVLFTSGSTGQPKGVMVSRAGMLNNMLAKVAPLGLSEDDVIAQTAPACFDISVWQTLTALLLGACVEIVPDAITRDPPALLDLVATRGVSLLEPVPSLLAALLDGEDSARPLPRLRWVLPTGEALPAATARTWFARYPAIPLMNAYGPAECSDDVAFQPLHAAPVDDSVAIGRPTANAELYVLGPDLAPVPVGVVGELAIGGVGVGRGYLADPARTAASFVPNPFGAPGSRLYLSGDRARWRADGVLDYLGRQDFQLKLRGFRIEPGEIEACLERHPGVQRALVSLYRHAGHELLVAYWQAREGVVVTEVELAAHIRAALPPYMLPGAWVRLARWPLNANGKIDRQALPPPCLDAAELEPPRSATEQRLAVLWAELLPAQRLGRQSHFFAAGGHSLLATRLLVRLRREFGVDLPLRAVFEAPVLAELATRLEALAGAPALDRPALRPVDRTETLPLAPSQQRLWLVDRLHGPSAAYNMAATLRLRGQVDVAALAASFRHLLDRHEVLRTAYPEEDGEPRVCIAATLPGPLTQRDLSSLPPTERQAEAEHETLVNLRAPFDLAQAPLLRARLLTLAPDEHLLTVALHHLVADGWSVGVLIRELSQLYAALAAGETPALPLLPVQYADYAAWQHACLQGEHLDRQVAFWRQTLAGAPQVLALPTDFPRPAQADSRGAAHGFRVPAATVARLEALAQAEGASLFMVLLASFQWLLHQVTGQRDLLLGTDVAGRDAAELEGLIGFFVNVLPLRAQLAPGLRFRDLLAQTKHHCLAAFEHQALPFDRIVDALAVPRERQRNPLVQALFVLQNTPAEAFALPGLDVTLLPPAERNSKFDMALFLEPDADGLVADWVYARALFTPARIEALAASWLSLLERVATTPDALILEPEPAPTPPRPETPAMGKRPDLGAKLAKLKTLPARGPSAPRPLISTRELQPGRALPLVIEPTVADLDPIAWAERSRDLIDSLLLRHAGLLFRGFALPSAADFEAFAEAIHPGLFGGYGDLPKKEGGRNIYRSTPYPERQMILYHNESAHLPRWPRKQWFYCELPSPVGGATPIVDCRELYRRLPAALRDRFTRQGLLYVRTFTERFDVSWREFFKTDDRTAVEAQLRASGTDFRWLDGDTLQTRTRCPAVIRHPLSGEPSFFNQVQLHHVACLEPEVREDLLGRVGYDRLPRHVYFGDGSAIDDEVMALIGQLYEDCAVRFDWQQGDVVMLDNMLAAHARDPYEGLRKIAVAMGDLHDRRHLPDTADSAALAE